MKVYKDLERKDKGYFKRISGLSKGKFNLLRNKINNYEESEINKNHMKRRGLKTSKMSLEDRILLTLYYIRHYPTFVNLANVFNISESYCYKIYKRYASILMEVEKLPNRKEMLDNPQEIIIIDVAEQEIERPVKKQDKYYSGKKKHTIKSQIIFCPLQTAILSVFCGKGRTHDFELFKRSKICLHPDSVILADLGYQGLDKYHGNCLLPIKKKKGQSLCKQDKAYNKALAKKRVLVEHAIRSCKIFRIVKDVYRGKHKNYSFNWNLVAALVNLRLASI